MHFIRNSKPFKMRCISWNSNGGLLRYGNPDMLFLATLKNKFHFSRFLTLNMQNLVLVFLSGFPLNSKVANLAEIWQPWKFEYLFFLKFYLKMTYGYLHSWLIVSEQRWLCVGEAHFHLFPLIRGRIKHILKCRHIYAASWYRAS